MSDSEIEIVVDDPTAPDDDSPAVTDVRVVDIAVSLLLIALARRSLRQLAHRISWDSTGPQPAIFRSICRSFSPAQPVRLVAAWLSRKEAVETFVTRAQLRRVMAVFVPTLLFCLATQFLGSMSRASF